VAAIGKTLQRRPWLQPVLIAAACAFSSAAYLLVARYGFHRFGFPLDDAWIYQAYARNLARDGQWAFIPGLPSTGSTSMLWTPLIAPAHLLGIDPRWWTHGLGLAMHIATALGAARLAACLIGESDKMRAGVSLAAGLAVGLEWHLAWAATSGMETGLLSALIVWFWVWAAGRVGPDRRTPGNGLALGLWAGLLMLARPEGVLAAGVAGLYGALSGDLRSQVGRRLAWAAAAAVGFGLLVGLFMGFNLAVSGSPWPNTFYAKQAEYAFLWTRPYILRLAQQIVQPFVGAQVLLAPGLLAWVIARLRRVSERAALLPLGWALAHAALYAWRLPVVYQHGRYAIPTVGVIVPFGVVGLAWLTRPGGPSLLKRTLMRAWRLAAAVTFPIFLLAAGAPAYGRDVQFIEDEMAATATWVATNTPPDTLIAAHDIGALGYFAPRPLVDLAGLVSPEVIPFIRDEERLLDYTLERKATYLVSFPGWYSVLTDDPRVCPVWSTAQVTPDPALSGLGRMTVYALRPEGGCYPPPDP
jgi:hypothetical protein